MPAEPISTLRSQKYISLASYRKNGAAVQTPLWFSEDSGKLYFMTRSDSWKYKRICNNPKVTVAPCTMRGRIVGPEFEATARLLPPEQWRFAKTLLTRKYWAMRLPWFW